MTREGAVKVSAVTGRRKRVSKRIRDADFAKTETPPQPKQAVRPSPGDTTLPPLTDTPSLPHASGAERGQDTAAAERVLERIDGTRTRKASRKAAREAQAEATVKEKSSRLQFINEERATPEPERYIRKSNEAVDCLGTTEAAIPKERKLIQEHIFDEATGESKAHLYLEEQEKPIGKNKPHSSSLSRPAQEAGIFVYNKIHSVEKGNSGTEGVHKSEELIECGAEHGARKVKEDYHSHKLKPYRAVVKAEKAAFKANVDLQYYKTLHDNPQIASNPLSRFMQKQQIKRQYAKLARKGGAKAAQKVAENIRKAAKRTTEETERVIVFVGRHSAGVCTAIAALLLFIMVSARLSSCGSMFSSLMSGTLGTSYTPEDSDLMATENSYAAREDELQQRVGSIESTRPGYNKYRYGLDSIGHNPHELASYLTAFLQVYAPQNAQAELSRVFAMQYTSTLIEGTGIRYRTETSTGPETREMVTEEVLYEYHILNIKLTNKPISEIAEELLTPQQLEIYRVYLEISGGKPLISGGDSPDMGASEDLGGIQLVNDTRPDNTAVVNPTKRQVGNVGGRLLWSWHGFNSRMEWRACFVSWCCNQAGKSGSRFAGYQSQGVPWFQSHEQWGTRSYEDIAPGDAIFFDQDGDGSANHVGPVIGTDGGRIYTVEGNSGDACKIESYPINYPCIKGYELMNQNQHILG